MHLGTTPRLIRSLDFRVRTVRSPDGSTPFKETLPMFIREVGEICVKSVGETEPTIDNIPGNGICEEAGLNEWLSQNAPACP